ncbi:MAG: hypothetical protein RLZZ574_2376 [Cyanobacteriota bacterium]|jgi:membrane protein YdbS with pleckstrin-like domain
MFLEENIVSTLAIAFFIICIIVIIHLSFFVSNSNAKKSIFTIFTQPLMYGFCISILDSFKYRNTSNFEISPSRAVGATLGLIAGFY